MPEIQNIIGKRRNTIIEYDGCIFNMNKIQNSAVRWGCEYWKCKAFILVLYSGVIENTPSHNHERNGKDSKKIEFHSSIKKKALEFSEWPFVIFRKNWKNQKMIKKDLNIKYKSVRDRIQRIRNKNLDIIYPTLVYIAEELMYDSNGDRFLLYDSGLEDNNRFLIFCTAFKKES